MATIQGWPEKDQSGFNHPVLTGLNHLKKPNFDHHKWSKLKNQDFSEVNINKWLIYKKINVNMLYLYVNVISFSTSERSSLFFDQPEGCLNRGTAGTDGMGLLLIWETVGPLLITFPVDLFRISGRKVSHFPAGY